MSITALESEFWSIKQVVKRVGMSRTTIWREERQGRFPRRIQLSRNRIGWLSSEVLSWMEAKHAAVNRADVLPIGRSEVARR